MACQGSFPLHVWDVPPIEYCMQVPHPTSYMTAMIFLMIAELIGQIYFNFLSPSSLHKLFEVMQSVFVCSCV